MLQAIKCYLKTRKDKDHICEHCLKPGDHVYYVTALGSASYVEEYIVRSKPYIEPGLSYFVKADHPELYQGRVISTTFSLRDCNVVKNDYNKHRLFRSAGAALTYKNFAIKNSYEPARGFYDC